MTPNYRTLPEALWRLYEHSGFAMAGAVAFSFIVSLFPFCIFLGAVAGMFAGGPDLAKEAVARLFDILPQRVAEGLAPQVEAIMTRSRLDLLTGGALIALFFATSATETMRTALNGAYRVKEDRPYPLCLLISAIFVFVTALSMLVLTWFVVVAPHMAAKWEPSWARTLLASGKLDWVTRYGLAGAVIAMQLFAYHLWLAAGHRTLRQVWPGVAVSVVLWLLTAGLYSYYLNFSDYTRFYAGLSQLMVALLFFQVTAIIIMLGAEVNRGIMEFDKVLNGGEPQEM